VPSRLVRAVGRLPWALAITRGPAHVVEFLNPAAREVVDGRDVLGRPVAEVVPEAVAHGVVEVLDRTYATGRPYRDLEHPVLDRRGGSPIERWFSVGYEPLREPDETVSGLVLYGMDITEQVRTRRRAEFLATASGVLLESSGAADAMRRAAAAAVPALGDVCLVHMRRPDGTLRDAVGAHRDATVDDALRLSPPRPGPAMYRVLETGRAEIVSGGSGFPGELPEGLGLRSALVVALAVTGEVLGTLTVGAVAPDRYGADDVGVLERLASRLAVVLEFARVHDTQHAARQGGERAQARNAALHELAAALSQAPTVTEIGRLAVVEATALIDADAASLFVLERGELERVHSAGWDADISASYRRLTLQRGRPLSDAVLDLEPIWLESAQQWRLRYPEMAPVHSSGGYEAAACLPLVVADGAVGGLVFSFLQPRTFSTDDRNYLSAVAALCAQAVDRARLYVVEQQARSLAERQRDRSAFLAQASLVLDAPVSSEERLQRLADLATPVLADWCVVHLIRGTAVDQIAVAHSDPAKLEFVRELQQRYPLDPHAETGAIQVARTGEAVFVPELTDDMLRLVAEDPAHLELLQRVGMRSAMIVPLAVPGRSLGALSLITAESGRVLDESDLVFAQDLADRAALALENARLYEQQRHIARTLQAALLPNELPTIPGIALAARYVAQGEDVEVGGDLYDVFAGPDGWAVAVGDVCGKGPVAAGLTAMVRFTLRAEVQHGRGPAAALQEVNAAMLRQREGTPGSFCTLVHGAITPAENGTAVRLAAGGHLPPMVLRRAGHVEILHVTGTMLGIFADPDLPETTLWLAPGDALLLYTDGVTEARSSGRFYGQSRLADLLRACAGDSAEQIADRLADDVLSFQAGNPRDDIAILVVQSTP
jgi:serine phosphatase RsbU (regulator of sigma subunit)